MQRKIQEAVRQTNEQAQQKMKEMKDNYDA